MSGSFEADLGTLQSAAQQVQQVNEQIQSALSSLHDRLEPLKSAWKGSAAASFQQLEDRWHSDATTLNRALGEIADSLKQAHGSYTAAESEVGHSISTITGRLG
jgi:WXG100 family type VII secretion target